MRKRVIGFFVVLFVFVLALAFITNSKTGSFSAISGYSVSVEDEPGNSKVYGTILGGLFAGFIFAYAVKFIFDIYEHKPKGTEIKKVIDLDLSES